MILSQLRRNIVSDNASSSTPTCASDDDALHLWRRVAYLPVVQRARRPNWAPYGKNTRATLFVWRGARVCICNRPVIVWQPSCRPKIQRQRKWSINHLIIHDSKVQNKGTKLSRSNNQPSSKLYHNLYINNQILRKKGISNLLLLIGIRLFLKLVFYRKFYLCKIYSL